MLPFPPPRMVPLKVLLLHLWLWLLPFLLASHPHSRSASTLPLLFSRDGVDDGARTTGFSNCGACIGVGEQDVVFSEHRVPALRHIVKDSALRCGLTFIADLDDVTGTNDQPWVTPGQAYGLYNLAGEYISELESFSRRCRGRLTGNSIVGSLSDDCRKVVKLNSATFRRLSEQPFAASVNIAYCSEAVVETFFSLLTYFGGRGVLRLTQYEFGRAFIMAARRWLSLHPAFSDLLKDLGLGVRSNPVYKTATRMMCDWYVPLQLALKTRADKKQEIASAVSAEAVVQRRSIATMLRKVLGVVRTLRVRPTHCAYRIEGWECQMRRLQLPDLMADTDVDGRSDDEDEDRVTAPHADAGAAPQSDSENNESGDELRQGDDICVLPAAGPDLFWIARVIRLNAQADKVVVYYYELGDDDGNYFLSRSPFEIDLRRLSAPLKCCRCPVLRSKPKPSSALQRPSARDWRIWCG